MPKQRLEGQSRQTVITAGNVGAQVAGLLQHDGRRQRQHQQRQAAITQQEPAGDEADNAGDNRGREIAR